MHSFELHRNIERFFSELDSIRPFTAGVAVLARYMDALNQHLSDIAEGGEKLNQGAGQIHALLAHAHRTTAGINHRQFFKALEYFQRSLPTLQPSSSAQSELISQLNARIEEFAELYDTFLSGQSGKNALPVLLTARQLQTNLQTFFDSLQLVEESLASADIPNMDEDELVLWLPSNFDLIDFTRRLDALHSIYSELCMLLSIPEGSHPLRISKIESGSLWAKVFGETRVIGMIAAFIEQTASWMYRTYTQEGKIASIPRKVETVDALLGLSKRLKESGIDTASMEAHIEKSAVSLSKDLAALLEGQSSVTVNKTTISVESELTRVLVERSATLRLDSPSSPNGEHPPSLPPPSESN